ncbi:MAG: primase, partial [Thermoplasmata archaeon]|nr:primase [Thermoplasmata archaeon]
REERRPERREDRGERRDDRRGRDERAPREDRGPREERQERAPREDREERRPEQPRQERREERAPREERQERAPREDRREERRAPREERAPRAEREPVEEPAAMAEAAAEPARPKGDREGKYLTILEELSGKLQAVMLNDAFERVGDKVAVRDLADTLKKDLPGVTQVVFDGVVTQRLIDIALDKKIQTLVGVKTGNITKKPAGVEVVTRADLA